MGAPVLCLLRKLATGFLCVFLVSAAHAAPRQLDWDLFSWTPAGPTNLSESFAVAGHPIVVTFAENTAALNADGSNPLFPLSPEINTRLTGGIVPAENGLHVSADFPDNLNPQVSVTFDFSAFPGGVSNVSFTLFDIDSNGTAYIEEAEVTAINTSGTINPSTMISGLANSIADANSIVAHALSNSSSSDGNATFLFSQSGITSVTVMYRNLVGTLDPGFMLMSIGDISFSAPEADIRIEHTVDNPAANTGDTVVFTITANNDGPDAATGIGVQSLLPAGFNYVSDNGGGDYAPLTGLWTVGSLNNGASASLQITATVNASGPYTNTASVASVNADDNNAANDSASATVIPDTTAPVVTPPADITTEATGPTTAVSLGTATATDNVDGALTATPDQSGPFAVGMHTITWTATDSAGNTGNAAQTVTVTDTTPPAVTAPAAITIEATGPTTAVSLGNATAVDLVDGALGATPDQTGPFGLGTHTISWSSTDAAGNTGIAQQIVTITDTTAPVVTPPADITIEATGTLTSVTLGTATAVDLVDGALGATPDQTGPFGLGMHTINWSSTDAAGNTGIAQQIVTVSDTTPPAVPTVNSLTTHDPSPVISGTTVLGTGEQLSVSVGGASYSVVPAAGNWTLDTGSAVPDSGIFNPNSGGTNGLTANEVTATATDGSGNFSVDTSNNELVIDVDADNDAIPDAIEGSSDTDFDGLSDLNDSDSDADGLADIQEIGVPLTDTDGDGILDSFDVDQTLGTDGNGDGVDDNTLPLDTDLDGLEDFRDIDADNDGIVDNVEVQGESGYTAPVTLDSDNDGLVDSYDSDSGGSALTAVNTDSDTEPDYIDTDSDNDNVPDSIEGHDANHDGVADFPTGSLDSDADGLLDDYDTATAPATDNAIASAAALQNTDSADERDWRDADDDNDGIPTASEDANNNGNYADDDTDSDGIPDYLEGNTSGLDPCVPDNTVAACDSDNDGVTDGEEIGNGTDPNNADTDGDGIPDGSENRDNDGDGLNDGNDQDSDNDGIDDSDEAGAMPTMPVDTDMDGIPDTIDADADNDGIPDVIETAADNDGDGIANYLDIDSDNDGIPDTVEADLDVFADLDGDQVNDVFDVDISLGNDADGNGVDDDIVPTSTDDDALPDYLDLDTDSDSIPDVVEGGGSDSNHDGIIDDLVNGQGSLPTPTDSDADGIGDWREADSIVSDLSDSDNDGIADIVDNLVGFGTASDLDGDGIPDDTEGDADSDGDGIPNELDTDSDGDGIPDSTEAGDIPALPVDTDDDGIQDYLDLDSDNDGINDELEGTNDYDNNGIPDYIDSGGHLDTAVSGHGGGAGGPLLILFLTVLGLRRRY